MEFEEYVYDTHRTAEELRHLLLKQYDDIHDLRRKLEVLSGKVVGPN